MSKMSDFDNDPSADDEVIARLDELLRAARKGLVRGIICIAFLRDGSASTIVQGEQSFLARLGAMELAKDGIKMLEGQAQHQRALATMPKGGTA